LNSRVAYQDVAATNDLLKNGMLRVQINDEWILIANAAGTYYAVSDTCTHEDASLSLGALSDDCIRCPLHGSRFRLRDGKALDDPADVDLAVYAIEVKDGRILVAPCTKINIKSP
tara:strand:+ start:2437 stop:2781 length:345 start_codon:yes stop_codon:yes gene_type:complete